MHCVNWIECDKFVVTFVKQRCCFTEQSKNCRINKFIALPYPVFNAYLCRATT